MLCSLSSINSNAGVVYECLCAPTCNWVEVVNLNAVLTWVRGQLLGGFTVNTTAGSWTTIVSVLLPSAGSYRCDFETTAGYTTTASQACPLVYGMTLMPGSGILVDNSDHQVDYAPSTTYLSAMSITTSALVIIGVGPQHVYVDMQELGASNCGTWFGSDSANIACLKVA